MNIKGPDPQSIYPRKGSSTKLVFLKNFIKSSNIIVGDYTYFDDPRYGPDKFEEYNVLYNYDLSKVKLVIGKFCAIAAETRFIMTGDHKLDAISTYPFPIFGNGVTIGNGAIIATRAVVVKDVPAYSIVAGNPAKVVKMRFDDKTITRLQKIAWWDWPIGKINQNLKLICNLDVDQLEAASHEIE
jgi:virginiamycin A acetyltransferase